MITLKQIAKKINGKVIGNDQHKIAFPAKIEEAKSNEITFFANEKYTSFLQTSNAGAIVISQNQYEKIKPMHHINYIVVEDAYSSFTKLLEEFKNKKKLKPAEKKIGKNTVVYPNVFIGENVTIGENCIIYANVSIYHDCVIGNNCILHSGAVIGSDGFGFAPQKDGSFHKIPQLGNVVIEDDCEIGANTCIAELADEILRGLSDDIFNRIFSNW